MALGTETLRVGISTPREDITLLLVGAETLASSGWGRQTLFIFSALLERGAGVQWILEKRTSLLFWGGGLWVVFFSVVGIEPRAKSYPHLLA